MATTNFFALLDDDESDEPQAVVSRAQGPVTASEKAAVAPKVAAKPQAAKVTSVNAGELASCVPDVSSLQRMPKHRRA